MEIIARRRVATAVLVWAVLAAAGVSALLQFSGPGEVRAVHFDGPTYDSMETLGEAADVVALGRVGRVIARQEDRGGDPHAETQGLPMVFHEFVVEESFSGEGGTFILGTYDPTSVVIEQASPVRTGQRLLVFAALKEDHEAPGITVVADYYTPLSADNGTFDVISDRVAARSSLVRGISLAQASAQGEEQPAPAGAAEAPRRKREFPLADVRDFLGRDI